jgi:hypothetical protein
LLKNPSAFAKLTRSPRADGFFSIFNLFKIRK